MSILIKGMEMPKENRLTLQISADGAVYVVNRCRITTETYTTDAVPVQPHGRLIDADALMKTCGMAIDCYDCPNGEHGWCKRSQDAANICEAIEDAPTIIEANEAE